MRKIHKIHGIFTKVWYNSMLSGVRNFEEN